MKVRLHIGGVIELELEDGLRPGTEDFDEALHDAWNELPDDDWLDAIGEEWEVKSIDGWTPEGYIYLLNRQEEQKS